MRVGLLAVDQAVYLMNQKTLTRRAVSPYGRILHCAVVVVVGSGSGGGGGGGGGSADAGVCVCVCVCV